MSAVSANIPRAAVSAPTGICGAFVTAGDPPVTRPHHPESTRSVSLLVYVLWVWTNAKCPFL